MYFRWYFPMRPDFSATSNSIHLKALEPLQPLDQAVEELGLGAVLRAS
jgi:hypothetical protein